MQHQAAQVILHVGGGILLPVHGDGGSIALDDPGVPNQQESHQHHAQRAHHGVLHVAVLLLLGFFVFVLTHGLFSPLKVMAAHWRRLQGIILKNRPDDKGAAVSMARIYSLFT